MEQKESKDKLGDRMKGYENETRYYLDTKKPVIIRLDGKAFHTFTRGFKKPFDNILVKAMQDTMLYLCENIQNCVFGYTQSDEITLVLLADRNENTSQWFDGNIQKMTSVSASMATMIFNRVFAELTVEEIDKNGSIWDMNEITAGYIETIIKSVNSGAFFDSRAFNVPKEDIVNCIIWRQLDAIRNSKQMVGQHYYSAKQLHGKNVDEIVEMLKNDHEVNWEDYATYLRHGSSCVKKKVKINVGLPTEAIRSKWVVDTNMPFIISDREYVERNLRYDFEVIEGENI